MLVGVYSRCLLVSLPQTIPPRIREPVMDGLIKVKDNEWVLFIGLGLCGLWQEKKKKDCCFWNVSPGEDVAYFI